MSRLLFNSSRALTAAALLCALLSGCTATGSYTDATEPDAAKLRFISNAQNSTLNYYDAQRCEGQTTGMLNNFLMVDTRRRVGMSIAPPANARGYLEIKLKPGNDAFLQVNTLGTGYVCGTAFNFTPQPGGEYELTLNMAAGRCSTNIQRLTHINNKEVRQPLPVFETGLPACSGRGALFPKAVQDTPERVALINSIVDARALSISSTNGRETPRMPPEKLDSLIAERKALMGTVTLPDDYWTQYRKNLQALDEESASNTERTLGFYKGVYHMRLSGTSDAILKQWLQPTDDTTKALVLANDKMMGQYFLNASRSVTLETLNHHMQRMGQLDQQYGVCARFEKCWRY